MCIHMRIDICAHAHIDICAHAHIDICGCPPIYASMPIDICVSAYMYIHALIFGHEHLGVYTLALVHK